MNRRRGEGAASSGESGEPRGDGGRGRRRPWRDDERGGDRVASAVTGERENEVRGGSVGAGRPVRPIELVGPT